MESKSRRLKELQRKLCLTPLEGLERKILEAELSIEKIHERLRYDALRAGKTKIVLSPDSPTRALLDSYNADLERLYREKEELILKQKRQQQEFDRTYGYTKLPARNIEIVYE